MIKIINVYGTFDMINIKEIQLIKKLKSLLIIVIEIKVLRTDFK